MDPLWNIKEGQRRMHLSCIRYKIAKNIKNILTQAIVNEENPRKIATEISKQIVYRAMLLRKGAISVAREAYARKDTISV